MIMFRHALAVAILVLVLLLVGCAGEEELTFGAVMPLHGPADMTDVRDGMQLAVSEVNDAGGVDGREIRLHVADSGSDPTGATEKLRNLNAEVSPLLVFSTLSSITRAVSSHAEAEEIPLIGLVATDPEIRRGKEWTYVFYPSAEHETAPIVSMMQQNGAEQVRVLYYDDAYGRSVRIEMDRRAELTGLDVSSRAYSGNETDLPELVAAAEGSDAVYLVGFATHIVAMHRELSSRGYNGMILSTSTVTVPALREEHDLDGIYAAAPLLYNDDFVFARDVAARYRSSYEREFSHYAATGYDIIKILAGLLDGADLDRRGVIEVLGDGFIYPGVFGEIRLPEGGHNIFFPLHPVRIDGKELEYLN